MRILVCGGRDYGDLTLLKRHSDLFKERAEQKARIFSELDRVSIEFSKYYDPDDNWLPSDIEIISGMARGADSCAVDWAIVSWCKYHAFPAQWDRYGKSAGYKRNAQMLEEGKPDLVMAFPGGKGTDMMVKLARKAGVEVRVYE